MLMSSALRLENLRGGSQDSLPFVFLLIKHSVPPFVEPFKQFCPFLTIHKFPINFSAHADLSDDSPCRAAPRCSRPVLDVFPVRRMHRGAALHWLSTRYGVIDAE